MGGHCHAALEVRGRGMGFAKVMREGVDVGRAPKAETGTLVACARSWADTAVFLVVNACVGQEFRVGNCEKSERAVKSGG